MDDTIVKRSDEFCFFRFVWNESHTNRITQKSFCVKPPSYNLRKICTDEFIKERFVKTFCGNWKHEICMIFYASTDI